MGAMPAPKRGPRDFPGHLVGVKTPGFQCSGQRFGPWLGEPGSHMPGDVAGKKSPALYGGYWKEAKQWRRAGGATAIYTEAGRTTDAHKVKGVDEDIPGGVDCKRRGTDEAAGSLQRPWRFLWFLTRVLYMKRLIPESRLQFKCSSRRERLLGLEIVRTISLETEGTWGGPGRKNTLWRAERRGDGYLYANTSAHIHLLHMRLNLKLTFTCLPLWFPW